MAAGVWLRRSCGLVSGRWRNDRYNHWDTLRHLTPPDDLTPDEWWLGIKLARGGMRHELRSQTPWDVPSATACPTRRTR